MFWIYFIFLLLLGVIFNPVSVSHAYADNVRIKMSTTTSTENSGLLYELLPPFEKMFNVKVDVIAVGTGKALKLGENGDVDIVFVHARKAEDKFVENGFGINRRDVMYNDFVIVGPVNDPGGIKGKDAVESLKKIYANKATFTSRGDDSGTHKKEKLLWEIAGLKPEGEWYLETGQGMGATIQIADEKQAYTLVDRGTYIAYEDKVDLIILSEGDKRLFNPYGIIAVNPAKHPHVHYVYAMTLIGWVTSPEGQKIIGDFKKGGKALFHPNAYK
ncbi:substrate-binding domain-containing protein [candidate division WOR-3 bacterium]|nr:substrate-binding domain-containing protein [candidate division WOR-3 bacterium]